jgi:hypothetical protein
MKPELQLRPHLWGTGQFVRRSCRIDMLQHMTDSLI